MPKRISSTHGWLVRALNLARKNDIHQAQRILKKISRRSFTPADLRLAAQINRRCDELELAEALWLEIECRGHMEPGDYYMLGSVQLQLSKPDIALHSFERELAIKSDGKNYYFESACIRLAHLLVQQRRFAQARITLALTDDKAEDYVEGIGLRNKAQILHEIAGLESSEH